MGTSANVLITRHGPTCSGHLCLYFIALDHPDTLFRLVLPCGQPLARYRVMTTN